MITAKTEPAPASFAARMTARARLLAEAHGKALLAARRRDPARWRDARNLWPGFALALTKD